MVVLKWIAVVSFFFFFFSEKATEIFAHLPSHLINLNLNFCLDSSPTMSSSFVTGSLSNFRLTAAVYPEAVARKSRASTVIWSGCDALTYLLQTSGRALARPSTWASSRLLFLAAWAWSFRRFFRSWGCSGLEAGSGGCCSTHGALPKGSREKD